MAYQMDFYGAKNYDAVLAAIEAKKVKYPSYVFIRDEDTETGRLAFMDKDKVLRFVRDEEQKSLVVRVDSLPDVSDGDTEVLYIYEDIVYVFNGSEFKPQYIDRTAEFEALAERITNLESKDEELEAADSNLAEQITALEEKIKASYKRIEYEVVKSPDNTLVDYFNKEIRIMIPADTDFATQENASSTGADGIFYIETRVYAPENAVNFRTDVNAIAENEPLEDFTGAYAGTDEFGRNYFIIYKPVAYFDTESSVWIYYGANSTTTHYVGWNQVTEWYDANGNIFASDIIRINLSNETCHHTIEPYYINEMSTKLAELQETVSELESGNMTFIELE